MHPTLFTFPGLDVPVASWGFLVAVALIFGWVLSLRLARADKLPADKLGTAYVLAAGMGLFGARALWVVQHPGAREGGWADYVQIQAGGMAIGGGLVLGLAVTFLFTQTKKIPFFAWTDCLAPALLLGTALERLGAFLAGAEFGVLVDSDFALAVRYPDTSPVYAYQKDIMQGLSFPPGESMPVHPTQLYAMAVLLVGFVIVMAWRRRRRFSGEVTFIALGVYVVAKMAIEDAFRVDGSPELSGFVTTGMVSATVLAAIAGIAYYALSRKAAVDPDALRQWRGGPWSSGGDMADDADAQKNAKKGSEKQSSAKKSSKKKSSKKKNSNKKGPKKDGKKDG